MTTLTKKRKMKRDTDRKMVSRFIERIYVVEAGFFPGDIEGFGLNCAHVSLLTNFRRNEVRPYILAAKKYAKINPSVRFGMSNYAITVDEDEGWVQELPDHQGLFLCTSRESLDRFWKIYDAIVEERTRYTHREMRKYPGRTNSPFSFTFMRAPR